MTAFPNAYFEKDNDARTGSKGDFIFREAADGVEFISIMFEMKNEMDETATKHKNEDFLKELDKDRREKKCEYAVLVSLLEIDNELYNNGIVDVSYRYEKMYVIRPQFFIPMITLLRNAALNSLQYRRELELARYLFGEEPGLYAFGGFEDAERKMLVYLPEYLDESVLYAEDSPVTCLEGTFFREDNLSHRDILGALMGAGIQRETVGDILVEPGRCLFFVTREIAP